jgi:hypothetical protein
MVYQPRFNAWLHSLVYPSTSSCIASSFIYTQPPALGFSSGRSFRAVAPLFLASWSVGVVPRSYCGLERDGTWIVCWERIWNGNVSDGDRRLDGRSPLWCGYRARERLIHFRYLDRNFISSRAWRKTLIAPKYSGWEEYDR